MDRLVPEEEGAAIAGLALVAEDGAVGGAERADDALPQAILGDMADAGLPPRRLTGFFCPVAPGTPSFVVSLDLVPAPDFGKRAVGRIRRLRAPV